MSERYKVLAIRTSIQSVISLSLRILRNSPSPSPLKKKILKLLCNLFQIRNSLEYTLLVPLLFIPLFIKTTLVLTKPINCMTFLSAFFPTPSS